MSSSSARVEFGTGSSWFRPNDGGRTGRAWRWLLVAGRGRGWRRDGRGLAPSRMGGGGGTLGVRGIDSVASERSMSDGRRREDGRVLESIVSNDEQRCLDDVENVDSSAPATCLISK